VKLKDILALIKDVPNFPREGVQFKDITPIFENPKAFKSLIDELSEAVARWKPQKIVAIESRGFVLAAPMAINLGCGLVLLRKRGKLPRETFKAEYHLEYGVDHMEMHVDAIKKGERVVILDDILATGGTLKAAASLVEQAGGKIKGSQVILELAFLEGAKNLDFPVQALVTQN